MAISLTVANGAAIGTLDGTHATATITGAEGAVTFKAHRRPAALSSIPVAIAAVDKGGGVYELTLTDLWLWWITVDDGVNTAEYPVWLWKSNYAVDVEIALSLQEIIIANKQAINVRLQKVDGFETAEVQQINLGLAEEIETVPSIELKLESTPSQWLSAPFGRVYQPKIKVVCYSHWDQDAQSEEVMLGQMAATVRDLLQLYERWTLNSGLQIADAVASDIQYQETMALDNKVIGMAVLDWSCRAEYAIPSAQ